MAPSDRAADLIASGKPFMVLLARLVEKKGVDVAIRAMARLHAPGDVRLLILGGGPLQPELETLAADLGVEREVVFAGAVEHPAAMDIAKRACLMVVPSLWEAFGMVCLEAMIAGRALIATASGGPEEIVVAGQTGTLVPPGDPVALAAAMETLLSDPAATERMGRSGRERALKHFTWAQMAERYEAVFRQAISAHGGGR
jgi:glycosyltransferase involved in cell wall biosynthesis